MYVIFPQDGKDMRENGLCWLCTEQAAAPLPVGRMPREPSLILSLESSRVVGGQNNLYQQVGI